MPVVLSDTKIQIWKQFTTARPIAEVPHWLYYLIQRYKFESNSQQQEHWGLRQLRCIIWYKDTNLKAIHNTSWTEPCVGIVVLSDTKIQIWKQFTTFRFVSQLQELLYYLIQRYKFESNSQLLTASCTSVSRCIIWYKDTNLKAIHNIRR